MGKNIRIIGKFLKTSNGLLKQSGKKSRLRFEIDVIKITFANEESKIDPEPRIKTKPEGWCGTTGKCATKE